MTPPWITNFAEEYVQGMKSLLGSPLYTVEHVTDLGENSVYRVQPNLSPEHRGICIGPPPLLVGNGSRFRVPTKEEKNQIYLAEYGDDPVLEQ